MARMQVSALYFSVAAFLAGWLLSYYGRQEDNQTMQEEVTSEPLIDLPKSYDLQEKALVDAVLDRINAHSLRNFLKTLSEKPHVAASDRDRWLTMWIRRKWEEFGLDSVSLSTYEFLISYPDTNNPNKIYLLDGDNRKVWTSRHHEDTIPNSGVHNGFIHAFNAYAPPGDITAELVYVNYGTVEDIEELVHLGVNLTGRIAIARYGKIFRGNKLMNCERAGAIGLILYSDPEEVAREGLEAEHLYPHTFFLPESGIQRGNVCQEDGDPLSPGWPSIQGAYRDTAHATQAVRDLCFEGRRGIPSQPIGYGDARRLLSIMGGDKVPSHWRGMLPDLDYRLGPGFDKQHREWRVRLVVNNYLEDKESSNVIGAIRGKVEPDRYVIIGNHRDSWGYGAADPSSGTCALMEIARVLGSMVRSGWRPRRTIVFASWAVEEYGLEGSYEYVYDNIQKMVDRAVAYINLDTCMAGPILAPKASPIMKDVVLAAIRDIADPLEETRSLYDFFVEYTKNETDKEAQSMGVEDRIKILGSGSDHSIFSFYAGVPSIYFRFEPDVHKYPGLTGYPVYHTGFDTFYLMDRVLDPGFRVIRSCAQLTAHMALNLGETNLLPLNISHIFTELDNALESMERNNITRLIHKNGAGPAFDLMIQKMNQFRRRAKLWLNRRARLTRPDPLEQRTLNDQLMMLERVFLLPKGLPGRPDVRHALFSPAKFDLYGSSAFPGIADLLFGVETTRGQKRRQIFEDLKKHLSDLMIIFHQAEQWLRDVHEL